MKKSKLLINNDIVSNSLGDDYVLSEKAHEMLALYEGDYDGIMPEDKYLLLGNLADGSTDSTRFGLVSKSEILGKVEF